MQTQNENQVERLACRHLRGHWIDKNVGRFRCYGCGFQVYSADLAPNKERMIEEWNPQNQVAPVER